MNKTNKKIIFFTIFLAIFIVVAIALIMFNIKNSYFLKSDFSNNTWWDAFNKLHERISKEYAFTDWKKTNWQKVYDEYSVKIKASQENNSIDEYYIALRNYLHEIPDGHVGCTNLRDIDDKYTAGGFGISIAKVEDGRIIITWVDESGPAWTSGLRTGAELIEWEGKKMPEALSEVTTVFTNNSATIEDLELKQVQYLVRDTIGKQISISFINEGESIPQRVLLTSYDDNKESLKKNYPNSVVSDRIRDAILEIENPNPMPEAMIEKRTLEGNISYIKVWGEFDADLKLEGKAPSTLDLFRLAIQDAMELNSNGIIVDLRNNLGGSDEMAADMLGSFYLDKTFYEYQYLYNHSKEQMEFLNSNSQTDLQGLYINPADHCYKGKIIALINTKCISSGEGIAMGIRNLPNGDTLGFYGTNGSFGLSGEEALMPEGLTVRWPSGQSLDENKKIQLDSRNGVGGVSPTIRIPLTADNAIRIANGEDVELIEAIKILSCDSGNGLR